MNEETKQVDLLLHSPDGDLITMEVAGNAKHEIHNSRFCLARDDVTKHVIVALNKGIRDKIVKKLELHPEIANDQRLTVVLLNQALVEDWLP